MSLMAAVDRMITALDRFEATVEDLKDRMATLEHEIRRTESTVGRTEDGVTELETRIKNIEEVVTTTDRRVDDFYDELHALTGEVGGLSREMPDVQELVEHLEREERLKMLAESRAGMTKLVEYAF